MLQEKDPYYRSNQTYEEVKSEVKDYEIEKEVENEV